MAPSDAEAGSASQLPAAAGTLLTTTYRSMASFAARGEKAARQVPAGAILTATYQSMASFAARGEKAARQVPAGAILTATYQSMASFAARAEKAARQVPAGTLLTNTYQSLASFTAKARADRQVPAGAVLATAAVGAVGAYLLWPAGAGAVATMKAPGVAGAVISRAAFAAKPQLYFSLLHKKRREFLAAFFNNYTAIKHRRKNTRRIIRRMEIIPKCCMLGMQLFSSRNIGRRYMKSTVMLIQ